MLYLLQQIIFYTLKAKGSTDAAQTWACMSRCKDGALAQATQPLEFLHAQSLLRDLPYFANA
jgi:hypothetical protein